MFIQKCSLHPRVCFPLRTFGIFAIQVLPEEQFTQKATIEELEGRKLIRDLLVVKRRKTTHDKSFPSPSSPAYFSRKMQVSELFSQLLQKPILLDLISQKVPTHLPSPILFLTTFLMIRSLKLTLLAQLLTLPPSSNLHVIGKWVQFSTCLNYFDLNLLHSFLDGGSSISR